MLRRFSSLLLLAALIGCAKPDRSHHAVAPEPRPTDTPVGARGFPRQVTDAAGVLVRLEAAPARIVATNGGALDLLLAIVPCESIVAVADVVLAYSPGATRTGDWTATPRFARYDSEEFLSLAPDLVVTHGWQNPTTTQTLRDNGLAVLVLPEVKTAQDLSTAIDLLGRLLDRNTDASRLQADLDRRLKQLSALAPLKDGRVLSYVNLGGGGTCAGKGTTFDLLCDFAGLTNAAGEAGFEGHAPLDNERLLLIDPDWIVVGLSSGSAEVSSSARTLRRQEALKDLRVVRENRILELPSDLFVCTSQYIVEAAEVLRGAIEDAR